MVKKNADQREAALRRRSRLAHKEETCSVGVDRRRCGITNSPPPENGEDNSRTLKARCIGETIQETSAGQGAQLSVTPGRKIRGKTRKMYLRRGPISPW